MLTTTQGAAMRWQVVAAIWLSITALLAIATTGQWRMKAEIELADVLAESVNLVALTLALVAAATSATIPTAESRVVEFGLGLVGWGLILDLLDEFVKRPKILKYLGEKGSIALGIFLVAVGLKDWLIASLAGRVSQEGERPKGVEFGLPAAAAAILLIPLAATLFSGELGAIDSVNVPNAVTDAALFVSSMISVFIVFRKVPPSGGVVGIIVGFLRGGFSFLAAFACFDFLDEFVDVPRTAEALSETFSLTLGLVMLAVGLWGVRLIVREVVEVPAPARLLIWLDPGEEYAPKLVRVLSSALGSRTLVAFTWRGSPVARVIAKSFPDSVLAYVRRGVQSLERISEREYKLGHSFQHVFSLLERLRKEYERPLVLVVDNMTDIALVAGIERAFAIVDGLRKRLDEDDALIALAFRETLPPDREREISSLFGPLASVGT